MINLILYKAIINHCLSYGTSASNSWNVFHLFMDLSRYGMATSLRSKYGGWGGRGD